MEAVRKRRSRLLRQRQGFTLNEVLLAIALIAIGILGFSMNTVGVIRGNQISNSVTVATNLAQAKLEEIKAQTSWTDVIGAADPNNPLAETGATGGKFNRTWTIKDAAGLSNLKEISVQVSWEEYGINRQVVLATLVFTG